MLRKHPKLFCDPKIDYPIYDLSLNFSDYIQKSKTIIKNTRQDLHKNAECIIDANAPFELRPANKPRYGALLIHGLLDSPFIMRDIGEHLRSQGILVRSIMLPGHSTVPGALLNVTYAEWLQAVRYGIAALKSDVDKLFLVGFSTGASLSIAHAAEDPAIVGLIMVSPATKINSPFAFAANWFKKFTFGWKRGKWLYAGREIDYAKYRSITFNAVYQVYQLGKLVQQIDLQKLANCPQFIALSYEDKIICSRTTIKSFEENTNSANRMLLYSGEKINYANQRIEVRNSSYPELGITNFCHITVPVAPNNPHYGLHGDYKQASHIDPNKFSYGAYDKIDTLFYQALYRLKLTKLIHRRLTFNPDFEFFMGQLDKFIEENYS